MKNIETGNNDGERLKMEYKDKKENKVTHKIRRNTKNKT
jgi:hypothetical protein